MDVTLSDDHLNDLQENLTTQKALCDDIRRQIDSLINQNKLRSQITSYNNNMSTMATTDAKEISTVTRQLDTQTAASQEAFMKVEEL